jgi:cupin superfamily acireductone dioxygenase involved in methionine salvage
MSSYKSQLNSVSALMVDYAKRQDSIEERVKSLEMSHVFIKERLISIQSSQARVEEFMAKFLVVGPQ